MVSQLPTTTQEQPAGERVLSEVMALIESGGPDAVVVRVVARRARVSLRDIYGQFGSRDELIVAAVEQWMDTHVYQPLAEPVPDAPLYETLLRHFRHIFEPWEQHPHALEAFVYARSTPAGHRLSAQGHKAAEPVMRAIFQEADRAYAEDVMLIMGSVVYAVMGRVAAGQLPISDVMPTIERVLARITTPLP